MDQAATPKSKSIFCNRCRTVTHHNLEGIKSYFLGGPTEEDVSPNYWGEYRLWACAGCDTCTMEDYYTADYMTSYAPPGGETGQEYQSDLYPKREHSARERKYYQSLPLNLKRIYDEAVTAINEQLPILCSIGLRALLEGICADKKIDGQNLEKRIDNLTSLLPANLVSNLHTFRFNGNDAAHELESPPDFELRTALDVMEDILNFLYALDYKASTLAGFRQGRRRPLPNSGTKAS
jgi:hypothetical protein